MDSDVKILDSLYEENEIYIFGAGDRGQFVLAGLREKGVNCLAFLDNNIEKQKSFSFYDVRCISPKKAKAGIPIVISPAEKYQKDIKEQLDKLFVQDDRKIYCLTDDIYWRMYRNISDEGIIRCRWLQRKPGIKLNLEHPQSFNEKIEWMKLNDRREEYTLLSDKKRVKEWLQNQNIKGLNIIPTIGTWKSFDEINREELPNQFVLKCTHDSGSIEICKDKTTFNFNEAKKKLSSALCRNYYWYDREWGYKGITPLIIGEPYLTDESGYELKDYKFQCFSGKVEIIQVDFGRFTNHRRNLYDRDWHFIQGEILYPSDPNVIIEKPKNLDNMIYIAERLAKPFPYVRIDLYDICEAVYFGEYTFYHGGGYEEFRPYELELKLGKLIKLT